MVDSLMLLLLLRRFRRVQLCATPSTAAQQAPPSLGFSRQEHCLGLNKCLVCSPTSSTLTWARNQHLSGTFNIWPFHSVSASQHVLSPRFLGVSPFTLQPKWTKDQGKFPCRFLGSFSKFHGSLLSKSQSP